ncbi:hypothetical protein Efla_003580 [Eimeria flavescens]
MGNTHIVALIDRHTRWVERVSLSSPSRTAFAEAEAFLNHWVSRWGARGTCAFYSSYLERARARSLWRAVIARPLALPPLRLARTPETSKAESPRGLCGLKRLRTGDACRLTPDAQRASGRGEVYPFN